MKAWEMAGHVFMLWWDASRKQRYSSRPSKVTQAGKTALKLLQKIDVSACSYPTVIMANTFSNWICYQTALFDKLLQTFSWNILSWMLKPLDLLPYDGGEKKNFPLLFHSSSGTWRVLWLLSILSIFPNYKYFPKTDSPLPNSLPYIATPHLYLCVFVENRTNLKFTGIYYWNYSNGGIHKMIFVSTYSWSIYAHIKWLVFF